MKRFELIPSNNFTRKFVTYDKKGLMACILDFEPEWIQLYMAGRIPMAEILSDHFLSAAIKPNGDWCTGDTIRSDGVQLQIVEVTPRKQAENAHMKILRQQGMAKKTEARAAADAAGVVLPSPRERDDPRHGYRPGEPILKVPTVESTLRWARVQKPPRNDLPPNTVIVGMDPGKKNLVAVAREDDLRHPWVYSTLQFRYDTGEIGRSRGQAKALAVRLHPVTGNLAFRRATDSVRQHSTKTAVYVDLLEAVRARRDAFPALYGFYGAQINARNKLANYIGAKCTMGILLKRIVKTADDFVIVGDGDFSSFNPKGTSCSRWKKLLRALLQYRRQFHYRHGVPRSRNELWLGKERTRVRDEFRTSCLNSITRRYHFNPATACVGRNGQPSVKRIYGVYLIHAVMEFTYPAYTQTRPMLAVDLINVQRPYRAFMDTHASCCISDIYIYICVYFLYINICTPVYLCCIHLCFF